MKQVFTTYTIIFMRNSFLSFFMFVSLVMFLSFQNPKKDVEIENEIITLSISLDESNNPFVGKVYNKQAGKILFSGKPCKFLNPTSGILSKPKVLKRDEGSFKVAEIVAQNKEWQFKWVYKLMKNSSTYSVQFSIKNLQSKNNKVIEYPVSNQAFAANGAKPKVKYWKSLSYKPVQREIAIGDSFSIASAMYSSEEPNELPYWEVNAGGTSAFFALAWSGGWKTQFARTADALEVNTVLPEPETQLILLPGEEIAGPEMLVTITDKPTEMEKRQVWLRERERRAALLYSQPAPSYPLIYNSWYAVEFNLSKEFIVNQLKAMEPYKFNAFVVDAGWYQKVGIWHPHNVKFPGTSLNEALAQVKKNGILAGIWSCPQLIASEDTLRLKAFVDKPGRHVPFMKAWLVDMAGTSFTDSLVNHVNALKQTFKVDWWKYDQDFFADATRQGKMKNVVALQQALAKVRQVNPQLYIENCMSGGRMVNEFTNSVAQIHWPKDVYNEGLEHAWSNFCENLGALQMMQPYMNQKWVNNPEKLAISDTAIVRFYAQSCLPGAFGISADLYKIPSEQQKVFIAETEAYRKLNPFKEEMLYDIYYPVNDTDAGYIVFYSTRLKMAAVLCGRKNTGKSFQVEVPLFSDAKTFSGKRMVNIDLKPYEYSRMEFFKLN